MVRVSLWQADAYDGQAQVTETLSLSLSLSFASFNRLDLPQYDSYADFQRKLLIAINYGAEGFGLV